MRNQARQQFVSASCFSWIFENPERLWIFECQANIQQTTMERLTILNTSKVSELIAVLCENNQMNYSNAKSRILFFVIT